MGRERDYLLVLDQSVRAKERVEEDPSFAVLRQANEILGEFREEKSSKLTEFLYSGRMVAHATPSVKLTLEDETVVDLWLKHKFDFEAWHFGFTMGISKGDELIPLYDMDWGKDAGVNVEGRPATRVELDIAARLLTHMHTELAAQKSPIAKV